MTARIISPFLLVFLLIACQSSPITDKEQLARQYYQALNESDFQRIAELQYDSIRVKEGPYTSTYSIADYVNWLQWDSVFQPTYKIVKAKPVDGGIELKISKLCRRIQFLNGGPMVSKEFIHFKEGKIHELEIKEFIAFNGDRWNAKREELVGWINEKHPELNGFIQDQTLQGGINYLKALALFENRQIPISSLDVEQEKKAILNTLNNETKAAFQRDYEAWQNYWVHDNDITKIYLDFPENTFSESMGWAEINQFVKNFFERHPEPEPVPKLLDNIKVRLYGNGAWVTYEQQDSLRGLKRETRLMEKIDGQWKIAGMQTTIYGFDE